MARSDIPDWQRQHARRLRRDMTLAERRLWHALRAHRFRGFGFRRQAPIGPYIADFVCHAAKLAIELDGGQQPDAARDVARDAWLAGKGYRILRFRDNAVLGNLEGVLGVIGREAASTPPPGPVPPPPPSPARGEGAPAAPDAPAEADGRTAGNAETGRDRQ